MMPTLHVQITAPALEQVPHPYSPTVQQHGGARILKPLRIMHNFQFNELAANSGYHTPCLVPDLQLPCALTEDPGELWGVRTANDGAPMQPEDPCIIESAPQ